MVPPDSATQSATAWSPFPTKPARCSEKKDENDEDGLRCSSPPLARGACASCGKAGAVTSPAGETRLVVENTRADKIVNLWPPSWRSCPASRSRRASSAASIPGCRWPNCSTSPGVDWAGNCSPLLTCYVLVEGADGYRVLFSVPEIDPQQRHKMVILADRCDGKPLSATDGPCQTIEEDAKQRGCSVKQVKSISLQMAARQHLRFH